MRAPGAQLIFYSVNLAPKSKTIWHRRREPERGLRFNNFSMDLWSMESGALVGLPEEGARSSDSSDSDYPSPSAGT